MRAADAVLGLSILGLLVPTASAQQENRIFEFRHLSPGGGGFLGVRIRDVAKDDVSSFKLPAERGVIVRDVDSDGPGGKAGLRQDDVIVKFQGEPVESASQFQRLVSETPPGRVVTLEVLRHGAPQALNATIGQGGLRFLRSDDEDGPLAGGMPPFPPMPPGGPMEPGARLFDRSYGPGKLGIRFEEIGGQLAQYFKVESGKGILVVEVDPDGPAAKAGLKAGDVVLKLDGKAVPGTRALLESVSRLETGSSVSLSVLRDGKPLDLHLTVGGRQEKHAEPTI